MIALSVIPGAATKILQDIVCKADLPHAPVLCTNCSGQLMAGMHEALSKHAFDAPDVFSASALSALSLPEYTH